MSAADILRLDLPALVAAMLACGTCGLLQLMQHPMARTS